METTIRDEGVMEAKAFEYIVKKELGNSGCVNGLGVKQPISSTHLKILLGCLLEDRVRRGERTI